MMFKKLPEHLTAVITVGYDCCSMPGDFGFDPLGLGKDPAAIKWYREAELIHGRLAMLAVSIGSPFAISDMLVVVPGMICVFYNMSCMHHNTQLY